MSVYKPLNIQIHCIIYASRKSIYQAIGGDLITKWHFQDIDALFEASLPCVTGRLCDRGDLKRKLELFAPVVSRWQGSHHEERFLAHVAENGFAFDCDWDEERCGADIVADMDGYFTGKPMNWCIVCPYENWDACRRVEEKDPTIEVFNHEDCSEADVYGRLLGDSGLCHKCDFDYFAKRWCSNSRGNNRPSDYDRENYLAARRVAEYDRTHPYNERKRDDYDAIRDYARADAEKGAARKQEHLKFMLFLATLAIAREQDASVPAIKATREAQREAAIRRGIVTFDAVFKRASYYDAVVYHYTPKATGGKWPTHAAFVFWWNDEKTPPTVSWHASKAAADRAAKARAKKMQAARYAFSATAPTIMIEAARALYKRGARAEADIKVDYLFDNR